MSIAFVRLGVIFPLTIFPAIWLSVSRGVGGDDCDAIALTG